ncbi:MAG TPA: peptide-methionine (S)-S-oxide reductase [Terriglobales bacterium]|nr:peptide-methionine (S)-S-oxide reductase [Terriglobales bacterium]
MKVVYDPSQITYGELLRVFFSVAHDPTELNRQGPDEGTQYGQQFSITVMSKNESPTHTLHN